MSVTVEKSVVVIMASVPAPAPPPRISDSTIEVLRKAPVDRTEAEVEELVVWDWMMLGSDASERELCTLFCVAFSRDW